VANPSNAEGCLDVRDACVVVDLERVLHALWVGTNDGIRVGHCSNNDDNGAQSHRFTVTVTGDREDFATLRIDVVQQRELVCRRVRRVRVCERCCLRHYLRRTIGTGWLETNFDVSPLHAFRRFAVPCNDPRWRVFPEDIQVTLEAALAGTSTDDAQPAAFVHESLTFSLGGPALEGNGELGTFQCGDSTFLVKRLFQTDAFVAAERTRRKQAFDEEVVCI
jgi:hypothetical protein